MGDRYLLDLADVCRSTGYPVIEVDNWQNRARGSGGYDNGRPNHVIIHHTASGPSSDGWPDVNYCCYGDDDAPLCNLYLSRNGTIYVCAAGATNTNGSGSDPCGIVSDDSMNAAAIGIEAGNNGTGEAWPMNQQGSYTALCAFLCAAYGIPVTQCHSHAEWSPRRKVDPAGPSAYAAGSATWNMTVFREDVAFELGPEPEPEPEPEEDDVSSFIIRNRDTGQVVLLAYDGAGVTATGLDGEDLDAYTARFGPWLDTNPVVFDDFIDKSS